MRSDGYFLFVAWGISSPSQTKAGTSCFALELLFSSTAAVGAGQKQLFVSFLLFCL